MSHKSERKLVDVTGEGTGTLNTDFGAGANREFTAFLDVSATTGTGEILDIKFQEWDEAGQDWTDLPAAAFAQAPAGASKERITFTTNANRLRMVRTVAGTAPTFDYTVGLLGAG